MAQAKFKWTQDASQKAVSMYVEADKSQNSLDDIARALSTEEVQVSRRQVIAKLTSEKVYIRPEPAPKAPKDEGPTKAEIMARISATGFDTEGFEGATKPALTRLAVMLEG